MIDQQTGEVIDGESLYYRQYGDIDNPIHLEKDENGQFIMEKKNLNSPYLTGSQSNLGPDDTGPLLQRLGLGLGLASWLMLELG
jgi:hypothetical protein